VALEQWPATLVLAGAGVGSLYYGARLLRAAQRIVDMPRSKLASAPQGYVEVQGFAWPVAETAQLDDREALYYLCWIERKVTRPGPNNERRTEWDTVFHHKVTHPFYLVDSTGVAKVDLRRCEFSLDSATVRSWRSLSLKEKRWITALVRSARIPGFPPSNFLWGLFSPSFRVTEDKLYVGSAMYAAGDVRTESQTKESVQLRGLAEFHQRVLRSDARSQRNVAALLDKDKDGKVSAKEAEEGYAFVAHLARKKPEPENAPAFPVHGVLGSSPDHKLLVANLHQQHLLKRMRRRVYLPLAAGPFFIGVGLYLLLFFSPY
jgi:hypothetical protein